MNHKILYTAFLMTISTSVLGLFFVFACCGFDYDNLAAALSSAVGDKEGLELTQEQLVDLGMFYFFLGGEEELGDFLTVS